MRFCDNSYLLSLFFLKSCINIQFLCIKSQTERENSHKILSEKEVGVVNSNLAYIREFFKRGKSCRRQETDHRDFYVREVEVVFNVC